MCDTKIREGFRFPGGSVVESFPFVAIPLSTILVGGPLGIPVGPSVFWCRVVHCCLQWRTSVGEEGVAVGLRLSLLGAFLDDAWYALLSLSATKTAGDCSWFALPRGVPSIAPPPTFSTRGKK